MKNEKMAAIMGRLRYDRQRKRGDFTRPREVPLEVWRGMSEDERHRCLMRRVRVSA